MKKTILWIVVSCLLVTTSFGQVSNATLTGTVADATGAVLPGVSITATNNATGVITTVLSNEAGAYNIQSLLPGTYTVSAELPGFQKQTYSNSAFGNGVTVRLNFTLQVASQAQSVEVTIAADTILATSSPTIGQVLTEKKVQDIPVVGNNVLDMLTLLGGLDNFVATGAPGQSAFGREGTTLAGVSAQSVPVLRDGVMVQDQRWPTGINTATVINPDLVGEIKLIVSPVDAELGRGNGAIQIQSRSGTNQFHGAAVWNTQNTALNPNTWANNRQQPARIEPNWSNINQGTISAGGPIVKNKTFFFALWDMNFNRGRANTSATVLTPCARNGVYRYFDSWNSGAYGITTTSGATPTTAVVDLNGNPAAPATNPTGGAYSGQLRHVSVFGPVSFPASGPNPDCSNGSISGAPWDQYRTGMDTTGLIKRTIAFMPAPNDYTITSGGDGLNTAAYRYLRPYRGLDNLFSVGEGTGNRKQININIDHNFSQSHRGNVRYTHERVVSDDTVAGLPGTWSNQNYHRPTTIAAGLVSTLSASIVNEVKFGYRVSGTNVVAPWDLPENDETLNAYLPSPVNGFKILPDIHGPLGVCSPITGARPPGNCLVGGLGAGGNIGNNITATAQDETPLWTYGDTISWTKGKHAYKVGGEMRFASSTSKGSSPGLAFFSNFKSPVVVAGGATPGSALLTTGPTAIANTNPVMSLMGTNDSARARNLLNFLSGSLQSVNNVYFLTDPSSDKFSDYRDQPLITNTIKQREFNLFFKDDYKVRPSLTLNLGVRWEWYGVPFSASGLTASPVGGGAAAFGVSGRDFTSWMRPGGVTLSDVTTLEFVGPNSPNSGKSVYKNDWNNFGPAVGFAWQVPWLGQDKTTVRGGYQITYQGGGRFSTLEGPLSNPPGKVFNGTYAGDSTNPYVSLATLSGSNIPTPIPSNQRPMLPIPITDRRQNITFFDPDYVAPYVQNLTLSITRSVHRNLTVDLRYIGTLSRKNYTSINLNSSNFLYNGLAAEFDRVRSGGESAMLDQMFNGINICASGCTAGVTYGPVGTAGQTAALQMRSSSTFQNNLALGNYSGLAASLNTLNYVKTATANANLPNIDSTVQGAVLRFNNFPENFIATNPQYNTVNYFSNMGNSNYHSMQAEVTLRPTHGVSSTVNYTWSRNLGLAGAFTNPTDRHLDYTIVNNNHPHVLRTNGTFELPFGPGKLVAGNSSGVLSRIVERWQVGVIYTLSSGGWQGITTNNSLYANGVPDVANAELLGELLDDAHVRWGTAAGNGTLEGRFFDPAKWTKVADPQCGMVTSAQNLNGLAPTTGAPLARCTMQALAKIVPGGTAGAVPLNDGTGNAGLIVLQNPLPGVRGNLGRNVFRDMPVFRFDANLSKAFQITESKSLQFRADVQNVLNHPQPAFAAQGASLSINSTNTATPFGQLPTKAGTRTFQGQLRLQF